jgi:hypothetical protein
LANPEDKREDGDRAKKRSGLTGLYTKKKCSGFASLKRVVILARRDEAREGAAASALTSGLVLNAFSAPLPSFMAHVADNQAQLIIINDDLENTRAKRRPQIH